MPVEYVVEDGIAHIGLNRPERLNAVSLDLVEGLCGALEEAIRDEVGVAVLFGRGRAFCAGYDLKQEPNDAGYTSSRREVERIQDVTRLIRRAPFPVVAAVHGYALGAGCEFALCSDLVVAAEDTVFGFPEVGVGLSITGGISHILPLAVGIARAKELVFLGGRFGAVEARQLGLVNSVVARAELMDEALRLAQALAALPRKALGLAKIALDRGPQNDLSCALELETLHALETRGSTEATQAAASFRKQS